MKIGNYSIWFSFYALPKTLALGIGFGKDDGKPPARHVGFYIPLGYIALNWEKKRS